jgi:hypothetical protein
VRGCLFCDRSADSQEHLLADWLSDVLPSQEHAVVSRQVGREGPVREWTRRPFRETSGVVCTDCNSGWMSDLEALSAGVLTPMLLGRPTHLDRDAQRIASAWATKTCLVFGNSASKESADLWPVDGGKALRKKGAPAATTRVWIGSHYRGVADPVNSVFVQRPLALASADPQIDTAGYSGLVNFLAVGMLAFTVISSVPAPAQVDPGGPLAEALIPIWPARAQSVDWPPSLMLDQEIFEPLLAAGDGFTVRVS